MEKIKLNDCKEGYFIEVLRDGNGLLKNLTIGRKYQVDKISEKGKIEFGSQNSKIMFRIRNDKNMIKWYVLSSDFRFSCLR
jgi:hypothetical protein